MTAEGDQVYRRIPDEDGYGIVDGEIDISGPAQDELALSLAHRPAVQTGLQGTLPNVWNRLEYGTLRRSWGGS